MDDDIFTSLMPANKLGGKYSTPTSQEKVTTWMQGQQVGANKDGAGKEQSSQGKGGSPGRRESGPNTPSNKSSSVSKMSPQMSHSSPLTTKQKMSYAGKQLAAAKRKFRQNDQYGCEECNYKWR